MSKTIILSESFLSDTDELEKRFLKKFRYLKYNRSVFLLIFVSMKGERKETILSETGKFLVDIAKLVFGGVILAGIMKYESVNSALLYGIGGIAVVACFISGLILLTLSKK